MASGVFRELITRLGFQVDEKSLTKYEKGIRKIKQGLAGLATAYTAKRIYDFTSDLVSKTVEYYDELGESAQKAGIKAQSLQKFRYAGGIAGVGVEQLGVGLKLLSKNLEAASSGSKEAQKSFAAVGIKDVKKFKSTEDVMVAISKAIEKIPDGSKKVALMLKIFGRSGSEMIPMLNNSKQLISDMDDFKAAGGEATDAMLEQGDKMDRGFRRAHMQVELLKLSIGNALLPKVEQITDAFSKWIVSDDAKIFVKDLSIVLDKMVTVGGWFGLAAKGAVEFIAKVTDKDKFMSEVVKPYKDFGARNSWIGKTYKGLKAAMFVANPVGAMITEAVESKGREKQTPDEIVKNSVRMAPKMGAFSDFGSFAEMPAATPAIVTATPTTAPIMPMVDKSQKTQHITYNNKFEINASGLSPDLVEDVVGDAVSSAQDDMNKQLQNNFPQ